MAYEMLIRDCTSTWYRPIYLCGEDHIVAVLARLEPCADDFFGRALRVGLWRHGIHFRRIKKIDAFGNGVVHLRVAIGFSVLLAPCHRAEADFTDLQVGADTFAVVHSYAPQRLSLVLVDRTRVV